METQLAIRTVRRLWVPPLDPKFVLPFQILDPSLTQFIVFPSKYFVVIFYVVAAADCRPALTLTFTAGLKKPAHYVAILLNIVCNIQQSVSEKVTSVALYTE